MHRLNILKVSVKVKTLWKWFSDSAAFHCNSNKTHEFF